MTAHPRPPGRPKFPDAAEIRQLPVQLTLNVPPDWEDRNGHVNVQYYQRLYELGGYRILEQIGLGEDWLDRSGVGLVDLEHHLHYRTELIVGQPVSCYNLILEVNPKRFHGVYLVLSDEVDRLACSLEYVTCAVDLESRRTVRLPGELFRGLQAEVRRVHALTWRAPLCGVMQP